ncbi:thyrotropin-releasing hormone receptor [Biomphalaria glabrata]|nr:thyrotropin-releasing hormone receptor-like [Biomphalaria glabrata]
MGFVYSTIRCGAKIRLKEFMTSMLFMTLMKSCECASHVNDSLVVDEISFEVIYETVNSDLDARKLSVNISGLTSDGPFLITSLPVVSSPREGINASASTDNSTTWPAAPIRYSVLFASVAATLSAIIFVFGLLGNILVVIVIARTRSMHTTTNCYLLSLAVADSLVLLSATLPSIPEPFFRVDEWPYGRTMCPILVFIQYLGVDSSSLSITALTIERYIAICHPMKAQTTCTVSRAKKIIVILWVFTLLYCSPWLGLTGQ